MRREDGFTLVELMVAAVLMIVVLGATLTAFEKFQTNSNSNQALNDSQEAARVAVDRIARELRNAAAPAKNSTISIARATATDFVFQSVDDTGASSGSNVRHAQWVRYCLDASVPNNEKVWRQTFTWSGATAPTAPFSATCPDSGVGTPQVIASGLVNSLNAPGTAMFQYDPPLPASPSATNYAQIQHVTIDLLVNADTKRQIKATQLTSGVYLRNQSVPPVARFDTPFVNANGRVYLNGSPSTDSLGNKLDYLWCDTTGGTSCTTSTAIGQGVTMTYDAPSGTRTITLQVTNSIGQTDTASQQVTVP
jgi:type II secretory pathway pseudopilin PulG